MSVTRLRLSIGVLVLLGSATAVVAKPTPEQKCVDAKAKAAGDAVYAATQCIAAAALAGTEIDQACFAKVEAKLREAYVKADAKGACAGVPEDLTGVAGDRCVLPFAEASAGDPKCIAKKLKAMATKTRGKVGCVRKIALQGAAVGPECYAKVESKFVAAILKAEKKSACTGSADALEATVDACISWLPLPLVCGDSASPTCGGSCPAGLSCRPYEVFQNGASVDAGCSCVDVVNGLECGEPVCSVDRHCAEPGFVCEQWKTDEDGCDHSICQPAMTTPTTLPPGPENGELCGEFPTCGGACGPGKRCQTVEAFYQGLALFAGCVCVEPTATRCETPPGDTCDLSYLPFSHCADPSLACLVTIDFVDGDKPFCLEAHCGQALPTTTSTSNTTTTVSTTSTTSSTSSSTSTTATTSTSTTTLPCVSTPSVSGCFEDLGNCTIRDNCTGLQWEAKQTVPGPHHVNNRYVWAGCCSDDCQTHCQPNAAAEATCLAMAEVSTDGCTDTCPDGGGCYVERGGLALTTIFDWINQLNAERFAGHDDWRLPSEAGFNPSGARELTSILEQPCTGDLCIDPIFGPTIQSGYWSRTTDAARSIDAWFVNFYDGGVGNLIKREPFSVRAVR